MLLDHRHDGVAVDVADDDHCHEIRTVPIAIEPHELLAPSVLDDIGLADGSPIRIARSVDLRAANLVLDSLIRAKMEPPFLEDNPALAVDASLIEHGALRPVFEHQQRAIEHAG